MQGKPLDAHQETQALLELQDTGFGPESFSISGSGGTCTLLGSRQREFGIFPPSKGPPRAPLSPLQLCLLRSQPIHVADKNVFARVSTAWQSIKHAHKFCADLMPLCAVFKSPFMLQKHRPH